VDYPTVEAPGTIIIDTPNTYLYLTLGLGKAIRYGVGVGREGFTWSGTEHISRMREWPLMLDAGEVAADKMVLGYTSGKRKPCDTIRRKRDRGLKTRNFLARLVLIGALLAVAVSSGVGAGHGPSAKSSDATTAEPVFALELDQLFRSDRKPTDPGDPELRAQAARVLDRTSLGVDESRFGAHA
jgi:hypothetical protein